MKTDEQKVTYLIGRIASIMLALACAELKTPKAVVDALMETLQEL